MSCRRLVFVWIATGLTLGCEEKTGIEALPASLQPVPSAEIEYYKVGSRRCPYWLEPFPSRDGKGGGHQCVNRATLRELCVAVDCKAMPGVPEHRLKALRE